MMALLNRPPLTVLQCATAGQASRPRMRWTKLNEDRRLFLLGDEQMPSAQERHSLAPRPFRMGPGPCIAHEVTNTGSDRAQLTNIASRAKGVLGVEKLEAVADRGYYSGEEILACDKAGIAVTLPKPMTSGVEARGRFGKQDFVYLSDEDAYRCPAGEKLTYHYTNEEDGQQLRRYWTNACRECALKASRTTGKERRITRWEHEHVLEEVQRRLDNTPHAMRQRRETLEHPFGTMKASMGATHFLTKTLPKVAAEMALSVLAYNLTRVMNIIGIKPLIAAIAA